MQKDVWTWRHADGIPCVNKPGWRCWESWCGRREDNDQNCDSGSAGWAFSFITGADKELCMEGSLTHTVTESSIKKLKTMLPVNKGVHIIDSLLLSAHSAALLT